MRCRYVPASCSCVPSFYDSDRADDDLDDASDGGQNQQGAGLRAGAGAGFGAAAPA